MEALALYFITILHQDQTPLILDESEKYKALCLE